MIGNGPVDYVAIRLSIAGLRAVAPVSIALPGSLHGQTKLVLFSCRAPSGFRSRVLPFRVPS